MMDLCLQLHLILSSEYTNFIIKICSKTLPSMKLIREAEDNGLKSRLRTNGQTLLTIEDLNTAHLLAKSS